MTILNLNERRCVRINPNAKLDQHASYISIVKTIILTPLLVVFWIALKVK